MLDVLFMCYCLTLMCPCYFLIPIILEWWQLSAVLFSYFPFSDHFMFINKMVLDTYLTISDFILPQCMCWYSINNLQIIFYHLQEMMMSLLASFMQHFWSKITSGASRNVRKWCRKCISLVMRQPMLSR